VFYIDLFRVLQEKHVRYFLVGGLAMNLHGVPRTTMDVDIVLALDSRNREAFIAAADALGLSPVAPVPLAELFDAKKRQEWIRTKNMIAFALRSPDVNGPTVDVLIELALDFDEALARVLWREVQGVRIPLAAAEDMIRLKQNTGRPQDQADIEHLRRIAKKSL
jgi:predicted nucleotidyltransferase